MTVRVSVAVMAHRRRKAMIPTLLDRLDRDATVVWDAGDNNRWNTGRRSMLAYEPEASHHLVVQDDAVIPRDLVAGIEAALSHVPDGSPLCLYCGRNRPYRDLVQQLVNRAGTTTTWLTMRQLHWGVGIVMPTKLIPDMIAWCDERTDIANYDRRISRWCQHQGLTVYYPWPSLVDHRDSPSLVPGRGSAGRRAHRFLGENASALDVDWSGGVVSIPALNVTETVYPQQRWSGGTPVRFVSLKYPNLDLSNKPNLGGVRFRGGVADVTRSNAVSILQSPYWQRRGIRLATPEALADLAGVVAGPPAEPDPTPTPPAGPAVGSPGELSEPVTNTPTEPDGDVPDGTAADVLAWVGDDPARARQALDAEQQRDKPRTSLVAKLDKIGQE